MLDIKLLKQEPEKIEKLLQFCDASVSIAPLLAVYNELNDIKKEYDEIRRYQKEKSLLIAQKKRRSEPVKEIITEMSEISDRLRVIKADLLAKEEECNYLLSRLPNIPDPTVRLSEDISENECVKEVGQRPSFDFPFKNHLELNEKLHLFDLKKSAKITGTGWPLFKGMGARLEWALINYMLNVHIANGYSQIIPPLLVNEDSMFCSGQFPKFRDQAFGFNDEHFPFYLIPTAEVALNAMYKGDIIEGLPLKYVSYTPCFRREAGAAGKKERGLIRTHQFNKVELFGFATADTSDLLFHEIIKSAESIVQSLGFHYRIMRLVSKDKSFAGAITYDIEVFLPSQNRYYEVSSVSHCRDFCGRRSAMRYRNAAGDTKFVHTINGSGLATSRLMVALLECFQQSDGSVLIPEVLQSYLGGDITALYPK